MKITLFPPWCSHPRILCSRILVQWNNKKQQKKRLTTKVTYFISIATLEITHYQFHVKLIWSLTKQNLLLLNQYFFSLSKSVGCFLRQQLARHNNIVPVFIFLTQNSIKFLVPMFNEMYTGLEMESLSLSPCSTWWESHRQVTYISRVSVFPPLK